MKDAESAVLAAKIANHHAHPAGRRARQQRSRRRGNVIGLADGRADTGTDDFAERLVRDGPLEPALGMAILVQPGYIGDEVADAAVKRDCIRAKIARRKGISMAFPQN